MKTSAPLANLITLGARDFVSLRDFYRNLGWPQIIDDGQFAAFELRGIVLALFPIDQLAHDGNAEPEPGTGGIRFTIEMMVDTPAEVDGLTESPWKSRRLLTLETRMQVCRRNSRLGSRRRADTARKRRPPRCGWCEHCVPNWAPIMERCSGWPASSATASSRCGAGYGRLTSTRDWLQGCQL